MIKEVLDYSVSDLVKYIKLHRLRTIIVCVLDIILAFVMVKLLYENNRGVVTYVCLMIFLTIAMFLVLSLLTNTNKYNAYTLYKKAKNKDVSLISKSISEEQLRLILVRYTNLVKETDNFDSLLKKLVLACSNNLRVNKKILRSLIRLEELQESKCKLDITYIGKFVLSVNYSEIKEGD